MGNYDRVASQLGLAPTLLDLMGVTARHPMIGRSLVGPEALRPNRAIMQFGDNNAYMDGDRVVVLQPRMPAQQFTHLGEALLPPSWTPRWSRPPGPMPCCPAGSTRTGCITRAPRLAAARREPARGRRARSGLQIFGRIYGFAAQKTAERADPSVFAALSDLADRIVAKSDLDTLGIRIEFQMRIVDASGSKRLPALIMPLVRIVQGNFYAMIPGSAEVDRVRIPDVAQAITSARSAAAEKACCRLIDEIGERVAACFR